MRKAISIHKTSVFRFDPPKLGSRTKRNYKIINLLLNTYQHIYIHIYTNPEINKTWYLMYILYIYLLLRSLELKNKPVVAEFPNLLCFFLGGWGGGGWGSYFRGYTIPKKKNNAPKPEKNIHTTYTDFTSTTRWPPYDHYINGRK